MDWYTTSGNRILNSLGQTGRLCGRNWFGFQSKVEVFHGLWAANLHALVQKVALRGFNCSRVPISVKVLQSWRSNNLNRDWRNNPVFNAELEGGSNFDVFNICLRDCRKLKMKVIDAAAGFGDGTSDAIWYNSVHPSEWTISALEWFADHFKTNDTIIGIDIRDQPHGACDASVGARWNAGTSDNNWKYFFENSAGGILGKNPNLLIFVEGIECYNKVWN
jgi:endoglucanase